MLVFFLAKCVRNAVKTMVVDRKNQKALALLYLASKLLRKAANSSGVPTEFEQNWRGKFELFAWTLSPNFFRLDWTLNFSPSTKKTTECSFQLFFAINKFVFDFCWNLFLTFVFDLIFYSFSTEGHKFISMYILLCVLPSLNKGFCLFVCCLCLFCYNAGQHAISRRKHTGFSTGLHPV